MNKIFTTFRLENSLKNILIFFPFLLSEKNFFSTTLIDLFLGFLVFTFVTSICYATNDYTDKKKDIVLNDLTLKSPFQPFSNDPKVIAEIIDKIVQSKEFREELFFQEQKFVNQIADPTKCAEWWDNLFEKVFKEYGTIHKKSSKVCCGTPSERVSR